MQRLDAASHVLWSQPNFIHEGPDPREYTPNDPQLGSQYHHALIDNFDAWDVTFGSSDIIIAVTDDGVDIQHQGSGRPPSGPTTGRSPATVWTNDGINYIDDVNGYKLPEQQQQSRCLIR